jgi:hypothetical protein
MDQVDLVSELMLTEEERVVDPELGYPHGYAKLCRHASTQLHGLVIPFTEGPPHRFLPYSPQSDDVSLLLHPSVCWCHASPKGNGHSQKRLARIEL